jgi:hypothetical protein
MERHEIIQGLEDITRLLRTSEKRALGTGEMETLRAAMALVKDKRAWKETHRRRVGMHLSKPGHPPNTFSYVKALYEVTEVRGQEVRTRLVDGTPLYEERTAEQEKRHPAIYELARSVARYTLFKVLRPVMEAFYRDLDELDGYTPEE